MSRHSFATLLALSIAARARPVPDDDDDDDDDCGSTTAAPSEVVLAPLPPTPQPSPSQALHATLPVPHHDQAPVILGSVFGVLIALVVLVLATRHLIRRRRRDPLEDPLNPTASKKRLSDESWASPTLPDLSQDLELTDSQPTEFAPRISPVRVPAPAYISPSPSISDPTETSSTRLSRLLSSTFRDSCEVDLVKAGSLRLAGARSRTDFYARDTLSTVSTAITPSASASTLQPAPVLKLRMSDASEHARYRLREKERERERREFRLRDSESVLREIGW